MAGNSFGKLLVLTTFGESHGPAIGGVLDGFPPGVVIDLEEVQKALDKRKPGQSSITTQRKESDQVELLSGVFEGKSTGAPIGFLIRNEDAKSKDYSHIKDTYRPSHADYAYDQKYGIRDYRGGGRSSARETACRVVAGALAGLWLKQHGIEVRAFVSQVGNVSLDKQLQIPSENQVEANMVRCPDPKIAAEMIALIEQVKKAGDTVGGKVNCIASGVPAGIGDPVFDKLHADLAKAMMSINAVKAFEIGSGVEAAKMLGSEHNDIFMQDGVTKTNYSGGIQGGISNGNLIECAVTFKPVATIMMDQQSIDKEGNETLVKGKGRHDPCVVPRAVPIVEAMMLLTIADHFLRQKAIQA
ncbi:MAG: chorismate synthase [Salibacteraceae bacterium]|nr:chorismate synthase [Salibacteraceae bacterium]